VLGRCADVRQRALLAAQARGDWLCDVGAARHDEIVRRGGTTLWGPVVAFGASFFFVGILAAIATPAYQDYTIRAQVVEGLNLATQAKLAVVERYADEQTWATIEPEAFDLASARCVESIVVDQGSVVVRYGRGANPAIAEQALAIGAGLETDGSVVWACGAAPHAPDVQPGPGPVGSDLPTKYLPQNCRGP
jgi:type IV pilus assembly protein PilA